MDKKVYELIDSYRDELIAMLRKWVRVPSVKGEPEDGAPFGRDVRRMLDLAMVDAETMGFMTGAYDGYACDITLGDAAEQIAVLGHLDVVPAGDGWNYPPFGAEMVGSRIYGRGTGDDKGPSLAALFAMRAIRDAGIPLKKGIRMILGCDEESGWEDMEHYCEVTDMPEIGFSPDASFPVINTEKGIEQMILRGKVGTAGPKILELKTGERFNVIPGVCKALLEGGSELADRVRAFAEKTGLEITAETGAEGVWVTANGIPGHSAYPEGCRNAIGMMLRLLKDLGADGAIGLLADKVGTEYDGSSLGVAAKDEVSGALTCNMGILWVEGDVVKATLDFRCPLCVDLEKLKQTVTDALPGFEIEVTEMKPIHYVPEDSELVSSLLKAYTEETGEEAHGEYTGGGTYAKIIRQGVAFGAGFPGDEDLAHQANEYIDIDKLILTTKIYANALIRLAAE